MKNFQFFILLLTFLIGCKSPEEKPSPKQPITKDTLIPPTSADTYIPPHPQVKLKSHLKDTTYVEGSFILFLRPNESRYAELDSTSEDGLGDADSDFGVGINNTFYSLKKRPEYKDIQGLTSTNRYINIRDCPEGPLVIDRDTVNH